MQHPTVRSSPGPAQEPVLFRQQDKRQLGHWTSLQCTKNEDCPLRNVHGQAKSRSCNEPFLSNMEINEGGG